MKKKEKYRIYLKCMHGGLGIRPMAGRASLLNGLNDSVPQMIDRVGENDEVTQGLWNSISSIIGAGSFDEVNKATCWGTFHASGSIFASDHLKEIDSLKARYRGTLEALGETPPQTPSLAPRTVALAAGRRNSTRSSWTNCAATKLGS